MRGPMKKSLITILTGLFLLLCNIKGTSFSSPRPFLPVTATLTGVVKSAQTGAPVTGAKVFAGGIETRSVTGGLYKFTGLGAGTYIVTCQKPGYDDYTSQPVTIPGSGTVNHNINLQEKLYPPGTVTAFLDTLNASVPVSWLAPAGDYELLYDDGIVDGFTVWATQGNMHGVRFSPAGYPVSVSGGSVHIGEVANYPPGSMPLVPFQIAVYDAAGPGAMPGALIGGPFVVIPSNYGWIDFSFPAPVNIGSGQFYLIMIQGGNAPNAAGIAIDQTVPALRSVSRHVTSGGPWIPGDGNFMMRALLTGPGGPLLTESSPEVLLHYEVFRLRQGEEMNPQVWTALGTVNTTSMTDYSWPALPCGPYRWGVKAKYTGNRPSTVTFSNIVPKCWTVPVTVHAALSCSSANPSGTSVEMTNLVYPDTTYHAILDSSGSVIFPKVWKGTYQISVSRFGYEGQWLTRSFSAGDSVGVFLLQKRPSPRNLAVQNQNLLATWHSPLCRDTLFHETFGSGSFLTNGWTTGGASNWMISMNSGNPPPSAMFYWSPQLLNYDQSLTGKIIQGVHSPVMHLGYDITLDNFGTTTLNEMSVEIWASGQWTLLENYSNAGGDIPWKHEILDISAYATSAFRLRFRAHGGDTYDINSWNIDNILVIAAETNEGINQCILGYNFYLNNAITAFVQDTFCLIPGNLAPYGTSHTACVIASYGSGFSPSVCDTFTSRFLWPPDSLTAEAVEDAAYMTWLKPRMPADTGGYVAPPGLTGYRIYRNDSLIHFIQQPDLTDWYDMNLEPGIYQYLVTAVYDLSSYGFPGLTDESWPDGPAILEIIYGRPLPFFEPWDQGSFAFNEWRFFPEQGNWTVTTPVGNPPPAARFSWDPPRSNYSFALESPALDGSAFDCANIWLDFDLHLTDAAQTGQEQLLVEIFYDHEWHTKTLQRNTSSTGWVSHHLDIRAVSGKAFRIRFRAAGVNSADITSWMIDNIKVYGVCYPARDLSAHVQGYDVTLTWQPPDCTGNALFLNEGFEGALFPPERWERVVTDSTNSWIHLPASAQIGVHEGSWAAAISTGYLHQDEWLIARDVLITGDLVFWSYAWQGSMKGDHYYVKISTDHGMNWTRLLDLSAMPPYPSASGYNAWETPYVVDLSSYRGQLVDLAWHATDGNGTGLWYIWAIDDCFVTTGDAPQTLIGYDIYRQHHGSNDFVRINGSPVADTVFTDHNLPAGAYLYFVQAIHSECPETDPSDTVNVDVITSIPGSEKPFLKVFPNPAADFLHIASGEPVTSVQLITPLGQAVRKIPVPSLTDFTVDLAGLEPGLYVVKIRTKISVDVFNIVRFK